MLTTGGTTAWLVVARNGLEEGSLDDSGGGESLGAESLLRRYKQPGYRSEHGTDAADRLKDSIVYVVVLGNGLGMSH